MTVYVKKSCAEETHTEIHTDSTMHNIINVCYVPSTNKDIIIERPHTLRDKECKDMYTSAGTYYFVRERKDV